MSRVIKFRAWDKRKSRWFDRSTVYLTQVEGPSFEYAADNAEHVQLMQFTGLTDKNGKEIYEGDLTCSDKHSAPTFVVVFHEGAYRLKDASGRVMAQVTSGTEVIGNIYENPDLLGV